MSATHTTPVLSPDDIVPPICAVFRRFLKRSGLKFTPERAMILDVVARKKHVFEAEDIQAELRENTDQRASKATVYRTLKHLLDAGIITEVLIDPKLAHYRLSFGKAPNGHLVCVETGAVIEIPSPWLSALRDKICREHDYDPISTRLIVYGIAPDAPSRNEDPPPIP